MGAELAAVVARRDRPPPRAPRRARRRPGCLRAWPGGCSARRARRSRSPARRRPRRAARERVSPTSVGQYASLVDASSALYLEPTFEPERTTPPGNGRMTFLTFCIAATARSAAASAACWSLRQDQEISAADRFHQARPSPRTRTRRPSPGCARSACRRSAWRSGSRRRNSAASGPARASRAPPPPGCRRRPPWSGR